MSTQQQPTSGQFNDGRPQPDGNFNGDPAAGMAAFGQEVRSQLQAANDSVEATRAEFTGRIEAVETRFTEWQQSEASRFQELMEGGRFAEVAEQLQAVETEVARLRQFGAGGAPAARAAGGMFSEYVANPELQAWIEEALKRGGKLDRKTMPEGKFKIPQLLQPGGRYSGRMVGGSWDGMFTDRGNVDIGLDQVGTLDPGFQRPGVIELLRDPIGLMDVINVVAPINSRDYDYERETEQSEGAVVGTTLASAIDGVPTPKTTCEVGSAHGFVPGEDVLFYTTGGIKTKALVSADTEASPNTLTFAVDDLDFDAAQGDTVTSERMLATAEGARKPSGFLATEEESEKVQLIATWVRSTMQRLVYSTKANLAAWIERRLPQRWREVMEWHLIWGSGTNNELKGFLNAAVLPAGNTDTWSTSLTTGDTRADLVLLAACQIPGDVRTVAVLNRKDWFRIGNYKASDGHYVQNLAEGPRIIDTPTLKAIGSVQVVLSRMMPETNGLVFAPDYASELAPGMISEMWTGFVGEDRLDNKVTHLYEADAAHAILQDRAFRKVVFDGPPASP